MSIVKETYKIGGMHCAGCVRSIEQALLQTKGVKSAAVNFANESALIEFDESVVSKDKLVEIVKNAGYSLEIESEVVDKQKAKHEHHTNNMKLKLVVGAVLALLIFFISIIEQISNNWILLILATPIQFWVGWQFYGGLKLLVKYRTADMNDMIDSAKKVQFVAEVVK